MSFDSKAVLAEVQANMARLESCALPHDFAPIASDARPMMKRHVCSKCRGEVDGSAAHWYRRGLEHARGAGA